MPVYKNNIAELHYVEINTAKSPDTPAVLWTHGWGRSHADFLPFIETLAPYARHITIDFPGFGQSPPPPENWGTAEYADFLADFVRENIGAPVIWVGHSFGCRVGLQFGARHPELLRGLFVIAGAGLKHIRPFKQSLWFKARVYGYKALKRLVPLKLVSEDWLKSKFGSRDYKNAGPLRGLFVKIVNEDLIEQAKKITAPTVLVYGENDTETPPEIGKRLHTLITSSEYIELPAQDHYTVLTSGRHPIVSRLKRFISDFS